MGAKHTRYPVTCNSEAERIALQRIAAEDGTTVSGLFREAMSLLMKRRARRLGVKLADMMGEGVDLSPAHIGAPFGNKSGKNRWINAKESEEGEEQDG